MMRHCLCILLLAAPCILPAQVFMQAFDNAAALALGGATVAFPGTGVGLSNDAIPGLGEKYGVYLGSSLPYGIGGWQTGQLQGFVQLSANDGLGLEVLHSSVDAYGEQRVRLVYGRRLGQKFLFGGSGDLLHVRAREYGSATTFNFGLSVLANPIPALWLGARLQNPLQLELGEAVIPSVFRLGAAWKAGPAFMALAEVEKDLERPAQLKAGLEYRPVTLLVLRLGARSEPARVSFGAGVRLKNGLQLDTGAEWHPVLGLTPALMLTWRKGTPKS